MIDIQGEEFNVSACIQFTLLQKILIKLAKRDQEMQDHINYLEKKLNLIHSSDEKSFQNIENTFQIIQNNIKKISEGEKDIDDNYPSSIIEKVIIKEREEIKEEEKKIIRKKKDEEENEYNDEEEEETEIKKKQRKKKLKNKKKKKYEVEEEEEEEEEDLNIEEENEIEEHEKKIIKKKKKEKKNNEEEFEDNIEEEEEIKLSHEKKNTIENNDENALNNIENNNQLKNTSSSELVSLLNKRIHQCEKKIEELQKSSKVHNTFTKEINKSKNDLKDNNKEIEKINKSILSLEEKLKQSKEEMDKIKVKVQDFNIYDLLQDNGDGNLDASKLLIMNLEKKVFTKFDQIDEKQKNIDIDLFKSKNDVTNCNNANSLTRREIENVKKNNEDLIKELNEHKDESLNNFNDINNKIADIYNKLNIIPNNDNNNNLNNNQIKDFVNNSLNDMEKKLMDKINNLIEEIKINSQKNENIFSSNEENLELLRNLSNKLNELEKQNKLKVNQEIIDEINKRLSNFEKELNKKGTKYDIEELNERLKYMEDRSKEISFSFEGLNDANEKFRNDISLVIRKIEFLSGQYAKLAFNKGNDSSNNKSNLFDFTKYVEISKYNDANKIINQKIDNLKYNLEGLQRNIDDILERLKHTPTEDDFTQFQNLLKAMLEDLRLSCSKRYADKIDVQKSFRYLETQIRQIIDNNMKRNEGESWLLAKKPMNGFLCASCESYIRDLNNKSDYVAWNKYPQRDDKTYRMGHGFSRMLQNVNSNLLKSQEMKDKNFISDDEINDLNYIQSGRNKDVILPIVSNQRNFNTVNNNNISNISNIDNNISNVNQSNINQSFNNVNKSVNVEKVRNDVNDPFKNGNESPNQPKITRIIKKNKGNVGNNSVVLDNNEGKSNGEYIQNLTEPNQ